MEVGGTVALHSFPHYVRNTYSILINCQRTPEEWFRLDKGQLWVYPIRAMSRCKISHCLFFCNDGINLSYCETRAWGTAKNSGRMVIQWLTRFLWDVDSDVVQNLGKHFFQWQLVSSESSWAENRDWEGARVLGYRVRRGIREERREYEIRKDLNGISPRGIDDNVIYMLFHTHTKVYQDARQTKQPLDDDRVKSWKEWEL